MRLRCELCIKNLCDTASRNTDDLKLRTIDGRDYLVCEFHTGGTNEKRTREGHISGVLPQTGKSDEQALSDKSNDAK